MKARSLFSHAALHLSALLFFLVLTASARAATKPEIAELNFDPQCEQAGALKAAKAPAWITQITQIGGHYLANPRCWHVAPAAPEGQGRISIAIDRTLMKQNLVATILFEADDTADLAVQLFDAQGRVVVVDLFGNLVDVGKDAATDTFFIPLHKYPSADHLVIRRISGEVKVYGVVLYPVVTEGTPVQEELEKLARTLGDPLSPENPLVKGLQHIAKGGNVPLGGTKVANAKDGDAAEKTRGVYPGALPPPAGMKIFPPSTEGLVGHWDFERGDASDASGRQHHGRIRGGAEIVDGLHGKALHLRKNPSSARAVSWDSATMPVTPDLNLTDSLTISAWIKYDTIAPTWGSQIAWFGDTQFGRDPWDLHLLNDGTLEFRTDRAVTGKPIFTVFGDELKLSAKGKPQPNQHVSVQSPKTLAAGTWYFVAGSIARLTPHLNVLKLYVNGEQVAEVKTPESVNYPSDQMWMTIGGVDEGTWQNFDGLIDDVRIYNRPLSAPEIKALSYQP